MFFRNCKAMDDSQLSVIAGNLPTLLSNTDCSTELLSHLAEILSLYDTQSIVSNLTKDTPSF